MNKSAATIITAPMLLTTKYSIIILLHLTPPNKNQHDDRCIRYQIEPDSTGDKSYAGKVWAASW
mgnify:CR=1 FL=1